MSNFEQLQQHFPNLKWEEEVQLAPFTYMKIGGPAEIFWKAENLADLIAVLQACWQAKIPFTVLGGGSNVLIPDAGLTGLVIVNMCQNIAVSGTTILADSGAKMASVVGTASAQKLTGIEPFLGVPGSVGGAVYNNAHYTTELVGDYVSRVRIVGENGQESWLMHDECSFAYDSSRFQKTKEIILQTEFSVQPGDPVQIQEKIRAATVRRATSQPLGTANSGCMFQNPHLTLEEFQKFEGKTVLSAGWLIDQTGLKNTRVGKAVVSDMHANFIVNEGGASSQEIEDLISLVQQKVQEKFGIALQREVFFLKQPQIQP